MIGESRVGNTIFELFLLLTTKQAFIVMMDVLWSDLAQGMVSCSPPPLFYSAQPWLWAACLVWSLSGKGLGRIFWAHCFLYRPTVSNCL